LQKHKAKLKTAYCIYACLPPESVVKIGLKITILAILPILLTAIVAFGVALYQKGVLESFFSHEIDSQARNEASKIAQAVYLMCRSAQESVQKTVDSNLRVAEDLLFRSGAVSFGQESVRWQAVNQFTGERAEIFLPPLLVGERWLGQNSDPEIFSPIVDEIRELVGGTVTIFQRANENGDMLRVATNVEQSDGRRAIGTYIPCCNPDGEPNPVISALLQGETFRGRAYVVNDWYVTAYRPILDPVDQRVVGALYVGIRQENLESLRMGIMDMVVGKTGYVYVLGGKGEQQGRYIISRAGERDGENLWDSRDSDGRPFIQAIIGKALSLPPGQRDGNIPVAYERYPWKNPGESESRYKAVAITYFAQWDWVIGAGYYESDLRESQQRMVLALQDMGTWLGMTALAMMLLSVPAGYLVANGIRYRVDSILKSVTDVLIVVDIRNRVMLMSQAAERLLNVPMAKARSRQLHQVFQDPTLRQKVSQALSRKQAGVRFGYEVVGSRLEASRILEGRTSLVLSPTGNPVGMIILMHDVTSERRIDRMKSEFISTAAHELQTPLASIIGYSELLLTQSRQRDENEMDSLTYINRKAWALSKIVDELLDVSRIESGHALPLEKEICDINDMLRQAVAVAGNLNSRHKFVLEVAETPFPLTVDRGKIEQVIENILSNAVKYSSQGGEIRVIGSIASESYDICVEDHGIGMTAEQIEKIFDKFYRVDSSNTAVEGTGLGMSIVRHIVDAHGGRVWVESEPDQGTRVFVSFPLGMEDIRGG
jgi:signal transduction histidine kinase